jgi:hypothetical protein
MRFHSVKYDEKLWVMAYKSKYCLQIFTEENIYLQGKTHLIMIAEFDGLDQPEKELMYSLPIYVAVLIAGADGKIDNNELKKAVAISGLKTTKARKELIDFYTEVNTDYEDKLKMTIANLPSDVREREKILIEKIAEVNAVMPKLESSFAVKLYASLKEIAKHIAEASGGVFGYMSVGYEESKLIDLKMIKKPS